MNEDGVRRIAQEEAERVLSDWLAQQRAAEAQQRAADAQATAAFVERHAREWEERLADDPDDGPALKAIKAAMRDA